MMLGPRYEGAPILTVAGSADDQARPFTRQRQRLQVLLNDLDEEQWQSASRCAAWTARDVVAHLVGVNAFWAASIRAGLAGAPTRVLARFDPVTTPALMVGSMQALSSAEVLAQFVSTNEALLEVVAGLTVDDWEMIAESPAGHVSVRLLAQHGLWDCWIHERDIAIPLGIEVAQEADEITSCLQYAAALGSVLGQGLGHVAVDRVAVDATNPDVRFIIDVAETVAIQSLTATPAPALACLRGDSVALVEALSLRAPMPSGAPVEWARLLDGLAAVFDAG